MIIGLCGKSGSGKTTVARAIIEDIPNAIHCDIDKIGHKVMAIKEVQEEAIKCFGVQITTEGKIDRKKLAELVFSSRERMQELRNITWKDMKTEINKIIQDEDVELLILDWILLPETDYFEMCDLKILLDVPYEIRKERAMARDNISAEAFDLRDGATEEYDKARFDLVISNGDINEIRKKVMK